MSKNQKKHSKHLFFRSLSTEAILHCSETMTKEEFGLIAKSIKWDAIPDNYIKYNDDILSKINWKLHIDKNRAIRIARSNLNDGQSIDKLPLHIYDYEFEELISTLQVQPTILEYVNISGEITVDQVLRVAKKKPEFLTMYDFNTDNLTDDQIYEFVKLGNSDFIESLNLDLSKLPLHERFKIIKASNFNQHTLESTGAFNEDFVNPFHIREIIIKTGDEYLDLLNLDCLFPSDWVKILRQHRHLYNRINIKELLDGDIYYLVEICMFIPEFVQYITDENAHKISSRGWEKLLVKYGTDNNNRLIELCDFSKIEQRSWRYIQREKPELLLYRV